MQWTVHGIVNNATGEYSFTFRADTAADVWSYLARLSDTEYANGATSFVYVITPPRRKEK